MTHPGSPAEGTDSKVSATGHLPWRDALLLWIRNHDESKLFVFGYVTLAVVLSLWLSLFWLVAVCVIHLIFELVRQGHYFGEAGAVVAEALWEVKLDFALVAFALALGLYIEAVFGILGLRSASQLATGVKAGARAGARIAGWQRVMRGVLLTLDDVVQVARSFVGRNGTGKRSPEPDHDSGIRCSWFGTWGWGDWLTILLGAVFVILIVAAPVLTEHTWETTLRALGAELHPFP